MRLVRAFLFRLRSPLSLLVFAAACSSAPPPPPAVPEWDVIPAGVSEALCARLKMDAIATGSLPIVRVTQPLVTPENIAALAGVSRRARPDLSAGMPPNRALPVTIGRGCAWVPIDVRDMPKHPDEMIVELSAPIANPYTRGEAGLFVRVSLGDQHPSWYWIRLVRVGEGWSAGFVSVLSR